MKINENRRWNAFKWIFIGGLWLTISLYYGIPIFRGYVDEFKLVGYGISTPPRIDECFQEFVEDEQGHAGYLETCAYTYEVDGKIYGGGNEVIFADDTIIYLPDKPSIHRVKHAMGTSYADFFLRRVLLGAALFILFTSPGIMILKAGIVAFWKNDDVIVP